MNIAKVDYGECKCQKMNCHPERTRAFERSAVLLISGEDLLASNAGQFVHREHLALPCGKARCSG
jgi:hypothetical protein